MALSSIKYDLYYICYFSKKMTLLFSYTAPTVFEIIPWIICVILACILIRLYYYRRNTLIEENKTEMEKLSSKILSSETSENIELHSEDRKYIILKKLLELSIVYHEYYDELVKLSKRKLSAGQTEELLSIMKSDSSIKIPNQKYLTLLDEVIMMIIPGFPDKVNELLSEEKKIPCTSNQPLGPELRITAMIALGVSETQMISMILNLSVNTVYTYRNRMKSRAKDRSSFENCLVKLISNS